MWNPRYCQIDPVTSFAGAALLCSIATERLSTRQSGLCSEILAWMMLPIVFKLARQPDANKFSKTAPFSNFQTRSASALSLWMVAVSIATFCVWKAEIGMLGFFPASTPLLLVAQKYLGSDLRTSRSDSRFSLCVNTVWGTALAASLFTVILSDWDLPGCLLSAVPVAALLVAYVILTPRTDRSILFFPPFDIGDAVLPLSLCVVGVFLIVLCVETVNFGFPQGKALPTLTLGLVKALTWYYTIQTARQSSWRTATALGTFSIISTRNPFSLSSGVQALSHALASFLALGQVIHLLPWHANAKSALWAFSLVSLVPYLANTLAIQNFQSSLVHSGKHPTQVLNYNAKSDFQDLIQKQSQTYTAAHDEYQRRYGIEPPPGFDAWYEFAKAHQSPIIDEFDMIYDAVSPFWKLSGKEVVDTMNRAHFAPSSDLWRCEFSGDQAKTHCSHSFRTFDRHFSLSFDNLLRDLPGVLPDVKFLINHLDEPTVLIPSQPLGGASHSNGQFVISDMSKKPAWDALTRFCSSQKSKKGARKIHTVETYDLPFVTDPLSAMSLCQHPEYKSMHGLLMSPTSLRLIEGAVPVLSTGSPSTMGDILFPSPAYNESEFHYEEAHDIEWDKKRSNLYWAGSTTGGFSLDSQWRHYHRQRFVELAQNLNTRQHYYLQEDGGIISRVKSSFLNSRLFDVAFTRIFQCESKSCRDQRMHFNTKSWANKDRPFQSRLVFDIDGNGISGRYYKLLASKSAPLKQTLLREWHDDRLMPWVHYIPVSQSMEELPEMVTYLTSTEAGQKLAREIADQGRDWFSKAFRDVDLTIYTYRLLLELARLQDPDRPAG
ncbi:hypothetical protein ASPWEDRAFT_154177 [Aspergillus wentii DTO 134E9]|uniref:Glycosyl transferase CAP10 domain-containing protein n=1 Tax=Aspergillus wentii DTO 134E9 TaxID=1073089 RepID=A0A1L9RIK4_ASPWE|nr:uncharacterized protein ASPWEDRAFT_154177 [Aspergillus wentii DTO 134E9]KAI9932284.1 F-actin-capping protein subunit beta [Aspergillus wentii]OJJ34755.1 hypothetical protein ASPWEDRAFT_154177 [Aspergillus wentii DTO 134E9]